ncbi:MAG TPA: Holliday junction branch migration protein RuvA [Candidatus Limnocylindrales bacterium]|nr:Holliday junction branch migration protein RuvA [Candidatus Limnocylindrales bacterium]
MIATLTGTIAEKLPDMLVLDVRGVGYGLLMPLTDYARLAVGDPAKIYVYEHIREASHDLFGFMQLDTKRLFEQLLNVTGVGPKMAISILNTGNPNDVRLAIAEGNVKFLQAASGVGKRVAERVVVDLKDKVGLISSDTATTFLQDSSLPNGDDAVQALVVLGFSPGDAVIALQNIDTGLPTEERIRLALRS